MSTVFTYRPPSGNVYQMEYRPGPPYYTIRILKHPPCSYPLGTTAHILEGNMMCVALGREPHTLERAKAIAMHWICCFESYRQTGIFPNGSATYDIAEVEEPGPRVHVPQVARPALARQAQAQPAVENWDASLRAAAGPAAAPVPAAQSTHTAAAPTVETTVTSAARKPVKKNSGPLTESIRSKMPGFVRRPRGSSWLRNSQPDAEE